MEGAADPLTYDRHHCGRSHRDPLTEVLVAVNRPALTQFQQEAELLLRVKAHGSLGMEGEQVLD